MTLRLIEIRDLAYRFVPDTAADSRLYDSGARAYHSWWPAHEIGHFLVATRAECRQRLFGLDDCFTSLSTYSASEPRFRYVIAKEIAATSISQRLLRRSGHTSLADEEIQYTNEATLECLFELWCKRFVEKLLRANKVMRLPTTRQGLEALLARKEREVTTSRPSRRATVDARR